MRMGGPFGLSATAVADWVERGGWVLVHSLWQFCLLGLIAVGVAILLRRHSASLRYVLYCTCLAATLSMPVITCLCLPTAGASETLSVAGPVSPALVESATVYEISRVPRGAATSPGAKEPARRWDAFAWPFTSWWREPSRIIRPWLPVAVAFWGVGTLLCSGRLLVSWWNVHRLSATGISLTDDKLHKILENVKTRLGIVRPVTVRLTLQIGGPIVLGCFRGTILLPLSLATELPATQLELILAHELAHVRRYDYLVNLLQTILETVFFYHPVVWWLSRQIRVERENSCDDLVVDRLGNRVQYGRALLAIEEHRQAHLQFALRARGGSLLARVQRLRQPQPVPGSMTSWAAGMLGTVIVGAVVAVLWSSTAATTVAQPRPPFIESVAPEAYAENVLVSWVHRGSVKFGGTEAEIRLVVYRDGTARTPGDGLREGESTLKLSPSELSRLVRQLTEDIDIATIRGSWFNGQPNLWSGSQDRFFVRDDGHPILLTCEYGWPSGSDHSDPQIQRFLRAMNVLTDVGYLVRAGGQDAIGRALPVANQGLSRFFPETELVKEEDFRFGEHFLDGRRRITFWRERSKDSRHERVRVEVIVAPSGELSLGDVRVNEEVVREGSTEIQRKVAPSAAPPQEPGETQEPVSNPAEAAKQPPQEPGESDVRRPWRAVGRVVDGRGKPLAGVTVRAATGIGTLLGGSSGVTDEDGRYDLRFGPGILMGRGPDGEDSPQTQYALVSARLDGHFEQNFNRHGNGIASLRPVPDSELKQWGVKPDQVCLPDRPRRIDFVMLPAAHVSGTLVDETGHPMTGYSVSLTGELLPPGSSVLAQVVVGEDGRFRIDDIPTGTAYQFEVRKPRAELKPPWQDSWASSPVRFADPGPADASMILGGGEEATERVTVQNFLLRIVGPGVHGKTAARQAAESPWQLPPDARAAPDGRRQELTWTLRNRGT